MLSVKRTVGMATLWTIRAVGSVRPEPGGSVYTVRVTRHLLIGLIGVLLCAPVPTALAQSDADAALARREAVTAILKTPQRDEAMPLAAQHAGDLRALTFDALPVAGELLGNDRVSTEAARAMLLLDERRGLATIFEATPRTALSAQLVAFSWFLEHGNTLGDRVDAEAHAAAVRVLDRIESTAMAQLALYTIGLTGSEADFPLLERIAGNTGAITQALRGPSQSALARLGSGTHLEAIRAEVATPLPANATYPQGIRVAESLRNAGLTGSPALIPAICTHIADPVVAVFDISVSPAGAAGTALSLILEMTSPIRPREGAKRSIEDWKTYCQEQVGSRE